MEKKKGNIEDCLQNEPAFCTAICPFHLDVRDIIAKIERGSFNSAYRTYLNAVGFPAIVAEVCDEPCKKVCPRSEKDGAISMRLLEKAAVDHARRTDPNSYNLPPKKEKVAIIGAGISGLACALRLAAKKYNVTVYEKSERIGGHLWEVLPSELFLKEFEHEFKYEKYTLCLNTEITDLGHMDFDAIYVATGSGGTDFGLTPDPQGAFASTTPGVFLGGSLTGTTSAQAIADGLRVTNAIERYIKTGLMNHPQENNSTLLELDPALIVRTGAVLPNDGNTYTREEAILEANRCLKCACDACLRYCDLMQYFKKMPKRIEEEVEITIHPGTLDGNGTVATRFISTCHYCSLCKEVCPLGIDTGAFLLESHRIMREKGAMPWAWHDFWLRDMEFTNGESAYLSRMPLGCTYSRYMFFPGCQLGASDAQYVVESYRWLLAHKPDTALTLGCCGAPAEWAGDQKLHAEVLDNLRKQWSNFGKPAFVFTCPTCQEMFKRYLPEIERVFLYDLISEWETPLPNRGSAEIVSIFDPCISRGEPALQQTVRDLAKQSGFALIPLPLEGRLSACCSWGGHVSIANPRYAREVIKARISQNDHPYITYCINCRDIFASAQKPVYHILDILFEINSSDRMPPTVTERRSNRIRLKNLLLNEFWKDDVKREESQSKIRLHIPPQLSQKLSNEMILENDIAAVIENCESSGKKVFDPQSGHFSGHLKIGNMTYWAVYRPVEDGYDLINAYGHRMAIDEA